MPPILPERASGGDRLMGQLRWKARHGRQVRAP